MWLKRVEINHSRAYRKTKKPLDMALADKEPLEIDLERHWEFGKMDKTVRAEGKRASILGEWSTTRSTERTDKRGLLSQILEGNMLKKSTHGKLDQTQ
jgi:hypothetical protein